MMSVVSEPLMMSFLKIDAGTRGRGDAEREIFITRVVYVSVCVLRWRSRRVAWCVIAARSAAALARRKPSSGCLA